MARFYAIFSLLFFLVPPFPVLAQTGTINGRVTDQKSEALGYSNVALIRLEDSTFISGTSTDAEGKFSLVSPPKGIYFLRLTAIGFKDLIVPAFQVSGSEFSRDLGMLTLIENNQVLKEVGVVTLRPTIVQHPDKLVVSVEGTALAESNTAYDVLVKTPGVFVDHNGNIHLNGRSGITVLIDGRRTYLSGADLRTYLEGMPAQNLKDIEIITNPSAKYEAEGASGILNINLKKNTQAGLNGSLYSGYTYNFKQHAYTAGGNVNHKAGNWNSFLNLDFARRTGGREATFTRVFKAAEKSTFFDQEAIGNYVVTGPPSVRLGTDYNLSSKHSVGFMINYRASNFEDEFLTDTYLGPAADAPTLYINADNFNRNRHRNLTTNLHYAGKLDTSGTTLTADLDLARIRNSGGANFFNYYETLTGPDPSYQDFLTTSSKSGFNIYSARLDYAKTLFGKYKMETGGRSSQVHSENDVRFYFNNGEKILDPTRTNAFDYKENIYAAYLNLNATLSKNLTAQGGLRMEHTQSTGTSPTTGKVTDRNYTNLFPSVFLQHTVTENYGVNYSYSRRIQRPNYGNLNPFIAYRDPYTWTTGNPFLRPQFTHSFSVAQSFKKTYNVTVSYQLVKDVISELPILDVEKATTIYYTGNVNEGHNASATAVIPFRVMKNWESQNTGVLSYTHFTMNTLGIDVVNQQVSYSLQSNHTILLPRKYRMEVSLLFRGPQASGLYRMAAVNWVDVSFRKSLLNDKLELSLTANDIFKGYRFKWTTDIAGNVNDFDQYFRFRAVGFRVRYNFNRGQKIDTRRRNITPEELNRT